MKNKFWKKKQTLIAVAVTPLHHVSISRESKLIGHLEYNERHCPQERDIIVQRSVKHSRMLSTKRGLTQKIPTEDRTLFNLE